VSIRVTPRSGMPVVALGLSAIDMLSCAMVSGLVLFLALSSPRTAAPFEGGRQGDLSGIQLQYESEATDPVMLLRIVDSNDAGRAAHFYSDQATSMHFVTDTTIRAAVVRPEGTVLEHVQEVESPDGLLARKLYLYSITEMHALPWDIWLTYADTKRELGSEVPVEARVVVDLKGSCRVRVTCQVGVGQSKLLERCDQTSDSSCSVKQILQDLATPTPRKK
jgi:hypothetical protein